VPEPFPETEVKQDYTESSRGGAETRSMVEMVHSFLQEFVFLSAPALLRELLFSGLCKTFVQGIRSDTQLRSYRHGATQCVTKHYVNLVPSQSDASPKFGT